MKMLRRNEGIVRTPKETNDGTSVSTDQNHFADRVFLAQLSQFIVYQSTEIE